MQRKTLVMLAACLAAAVVAVSYFTWSQFFLPQLPNRYERNVVRSVDNLEEENALAATEAINYSAITSLERFVGSSDPQDYLHPGTYLAYTYANFIDSEVLNYYETRFIGQQGKDTPKHVKYTYEANVTEYSSFRIFNSPAPSGVTWHNNTIVMSSPDGSVTFNSGSMKFFYKNQSSYQMVEWEYDFSFSDCYCIEMKLAYSEYYAPVAAFFAEVHQIVVVDQNLEPVLVGLESVRMVA